MARDVTANKMVYMRWLGFRPGEPHLLIWGQPQATFGERLGPRKQIYRLLHNQTFLNCYEISNDTLRQWVDWITAHCPSIVEGYADALSDLSQYVLDRGIALPRPRGVITGAGVLSPQMRKTIARAFRAPVLNRYGSREVGDIACSCLDDTALHVDELSYVVEIVDSTGGACAPGVEGDVLVTVFSNHTMPLIRYRIEDRAAWTNSACACGRLTRRLLTVAGRRNDYLVAADGTHINGTALTTLLYPVAGIRRFQYRQTRDAVVLSIVTAEAASEVTVRRDLEPILPRANQLLRGTPLRVEFVESISPSPSGKHRYILNELRGQPPAGGHSGS
jgi:phenylacetate-CoA ligase